MGHGKLWNYHLQYLNYLNDDTTSISERNKVLIQLSESVNACAFKLEAYPVSLRIINTLLFYEYVTTDQNLLTVHSLDKSIFGEQSGISDSRQSFVRELYSLMYGSALYE